MFQQVAIRICIESDELTGLHHPVSSTDPENSPEVVIGVSDHARALFSAAREQPLDQEEEPGRWVPHQRFLAPRMPGHLVETCEPSANSRFYAVKLQEGELQVEQEEEQLDQDMGQPMEEEAATGADAAAAAEPATGAAEPATGAAPLPSLLPGQLPPEELAEMQALNCELRRCMVDLTTLEDRVPCHQPDVLVHD